MTAGHNGKFLMPAGHNIWKFIERIKLYCSKEDLLHIS